MLVDIDDSDVGVWCVWVCRVRRDRAIAKTGVQRVVLETLQKSENRSGPFPQKCEVVERKRQQRDDDADQERDAVLPPRFEQLVETKCQTGEPRFFWRGWHRGDALLAKYEV